MRGDTTRTHTDGSPKRKPYRPPRLVVHGDLRTLTGVKGGTGNDGAGKPRTRLSGTRA
jgi:hypothetical protein